MVTNFNGEQKPESPKMNADMARVSQPIKSESPVPHDNVSSPSTAARYGEVAHASALKLAMYPASNPIEPFKEVLSPADTVKSE